MWFVCNKALTEKKQRNVKREKSLLHKHQKLI